MKGAITSDTMLLIYGIVGGLLILIVFANIITSLFLTQCWSNTIGEWKEVKDEVNSETSGSSVDVVMRSECLKGIALYPQTDSVSKCNQDCQQLNKDKESFLSKIGISNLEDDLEKCEAKCKQCESQDPSNQCLVIVPKIPSAANYFKVWEWFKTYSARDAVVSTFLFKNPVLFRPLPAVPSEGAQNYCINIQPAGPPVAGSQQYTISSEGGKCNA